MLAGNPACRRTAVDHGRMDTTLGNVLFPVGTTLNVYPASPATSVEASRSGRCWPTQGQGHTDPKTTLGIHAQVIVSRTDHGAALDGLVGASDWAQKGTNVPESDPLVLSPTHP